MAQSIKAYPGLYEVYKHLFEIDTLFSKKFIDHHADIYGKALAQTLFITTVCKLARREGMVSPFISLPAVGVCPAVMAGNGGIFNYLYKHADYTEILMVGARVSSSLYDDRWDVRFAGIPSHRWRDDKTRSYAMYENPKAEDLGLITRQRGIGPEFTVVVYEAMQLLLSGSTRAEAMEYIIVNSTYRLSTNALLKARTRRFRDPMIRPAIRIMQGLRTGIRDRQRSRANTFRSEQEERFRGSDAQPYSGQEEGAQVSSSQQSQAVVDRPQVVTMSNGSVYANPLFNDISTDTNAGDTYSISVGGTSTTTAAITASSSTSRYFTAWDT